MPGSRPAWQGVYNADAHLGRLNRRLFSRLQADAQTMRFQLPYCKSSNG
ncbi:hypothetical protein B4098_3006 [Heyndrickxia coagulans]|uniref:Uncharacterized protein n=1 Tax=Heyndrickxia coagulans TaxID=1398 RepID=A0A150JU56_HEYCO|nr:hypothetical protein B4098_3006 [Heyndrickxia coagulans]